MSKSKHTEAQMIAELKQVKAGQEGRVAGVRCVEARDKYVARSDNLNLPWSLHEEHDVWAISG